MRVFELAREISKSSKEIIQFAAQQGVSLNNHMVAVPESIEQMLRRSSVSAAGPAAVTDAPRKPVPVVERKPAVSVEPKPVAAVEKKSAPAVERKPVASPKVSQRAPAAAAPVPAKPAPAAPKPLSLPYPLRVVDLAKAVDRSVVDLVGKLMSMGMMVSANAPLDKDAAVLLAQEYGYDLQFKEETEVRPVESRDTEEREDPASLRPRPPVVVVMGHVDHGKTTLLDSIRKTHVAAGEFGGITQHIGAYRVVLSNGKTMTFLDTPGHEAFTAMRARGANVTDLVVLVVAADDGVMPQTVEAISHAKAAGVPILVALNKVDKAESDKQRVLKGLSDHGLNPEAWGGDTVVVEVSALKGTGVSNLLEMIDLQADLLDLKANPDRVAFGTVVESKLERGRGPTATVLVQKGTLKVGDVFVCGVTIGRVKALIDEFGKRLTGASPSTPVEILGFTEAPLAGDRFHVVPDERTAKAIAEDRLKVRKDLARRRHEAPLTLEAMTENLKEGEKPVVPLLLKADVQGSLEAIRDALERLRIDEVPIRVLHAALGGITESDVLLAAASHATVLGFNVRPDERATATSEREGVDMRSYRIIYDLLDDVKKAVTGRMSPRMEERVIGTAEVREIFKISKFGTVAGCMVKDGKIERRGKIRVVRDGVVAYDGKIGSLKRFKEDVREVEKGYECGVLVENFNDIKSGDILEVYLIEEMAPTL